MESLLDFLPVNLADCSPCYTWQRDWSIASVHTTTWHHCCGSFTGCLCQNAWLSNSASWHLLKTIWTLPKQYFYRPNAVSGAQVLTIRIIGLSKTLTSLQYTTDIKCNKMENMSKQEMVLEKTGKSHVERFTTVCRTRMWSFSGTEWASYNIGVFLCDQCARVHRSLDSHISEVKSLRLNKWDAAQIEVLCK